MPVNEQRIFSRRDFLKLMGLAGAGAVVAGLGISIPGPEIIPVIDYPNPGWLESRNQGNPPFIDTDQGHKEYIRHICFNDPLFNDPKNNKGILRTAFTDFFLSEAPSKYPKLGDEFNKHIEYARNGLRDMFSPRQYGEPTMENILHVAFISFAAVFSPYFEYGEIKERFGIPLEMNIDHASIWWLPQISRKVPTVYPADASKCNGSSGDILYRCLGVDRAVHFAQHAAISHLYAYGMKYNLPYVKRMPRGVSGLLVSQATIKDKTRLFSQTAGTMWEVKETVDYLSGNGVPDDNNKQIVSGMIDLLVVKDFKANALGTETALLVTDTGQNPVTQDALDDLITMLNSDAVNTLSIKSSLLQPQVVFSR